MLTTKPAQMELRWLNTRFHSLTYDIPNEKWTVRFLPGMNVPGFTLCHLARTLDSPETGSVAMGKPI